MNVCGEKIKRIFLTNGYKMKKIYKNTCNFVAMSMMINYN